MFNKCFLILVLFVGVISGFREECEQPLHHGVQQCTNTSSVRFHFDRETRKCLAFKYSGCGGNENNFEGFQECQSFCIPMDYFTCPGGSKPVANKNGKHNCGGFLKTNCDGKNAYCLSGPFTGLCCDSGARDKINADYEKECGPGKLKHQIDLGGHFIPLFGKSCDSAFCPSNSKCQQGNYYAYCCV